ncbi:MAG: hypothetical protein R6V48_03495 [Fidelibacterota bacterium]
MKRICVVVLTAFITVSFLSAQYNGEIREFNRENVGYDFSNAEEQAAFLDWSRIRMHHGVSMSMGSSALGSESYLTYHNQFYMPLSSKLSFYGNLYWQLQAYASNPALERVESPAGDIYFDANLVYKLGENSSLRLGVARYPSNYYNPYFPGSYSPYRSVTRGMGGLIP